MRRFRGNDFRGEDEFQLVWTLFHFQDLLHSQGAVQTHAHLQQVGNQDLFLR